MMSLLISFFLKKIWSTKMSTPNPYHESPFAFHIAVKRVRLTLVIEEKNILAMLIPIKTSLSKEN